jgi:FkbM family methyltransferase
MRDRLIHTALQVRASICKTVPMIDKSQQWLRMMAEKAGVQVRGPKHRGISIGFDIKRSLPRQPTVIFDVGAHRGESLYEFTNWFPAAHVYCFEPGSEAYTALCKRARKNPRITCVKTALGDRVEEKTLYVRRGTDNSSLSNYVSEHPLEDLQGMEAVCVSTIDNYCADRGVDRIDLLKVDTEGLDLNVLSGGRSMFDRSAIGTVQVEAGISPENRKHVPFSELNDFFTKYGYSLFGVYNQTPEWTTGRSALRRCDLVFMSPENSSRPVETVRHTSAR